MLVQRLSKIQSEHGYLPDAALHALAAETKTPLYRLQELASFFPHFRQEWNKPPRVEVHVCRDMACHLRGAREIMERLKPLARAGEHGVEVRGVSCIGRCDRAVAVSVTRHGRADGFHDALYAGRSPDEVTETVAAIVRGESPAPDTDRAYSAAKIGRANWQIDVYSEIAYTDKPYEAVRQYLEAHPEAVYPPDAASIPPPPFRKDGDPHPPEDIAKHQVEYIADFAKSKNPWMNRLSTADLRGFGGAGIPAYTKWFDVWKAKPVDGGTDKYIVCNADESEPATFKDRELLLQTPHLVVEGVILAGLMTNAKAGYIFVRHEYGEQIAALKKEIDRALEIKACGRGIFNTNRDFSVEVFTSPGGYICGEESALIEAMEDRRGQPRNKPPEMQTNGLYDRPTVVNNVETLAWVPAIMLRGGEWYAKAGTNGGRGRRFFSLCGDVENPGVYEVPVGTTLGALIQMAGGLRGGLPLTAVALSGPSGGLVPARLQLPADFESRIKKVIGTKDEVLIRSVVPKGSAFADVSDLPLDKSLLVTLSRYLDYKLMLGAGLAVFAGPTDVLDHAVGFTEFFRNESCGKCVPCRIGSQKLVDIGHDLAAQQRAGTLTRTSLEVLRGDVIELDKALQQTSICGLGRVAGSPLATALVYFADAIAPPSEG